MPRVTEIETDRDDPILKSIFSKEEELFGAPLNPTKAFAHRPALLKAMKSLGEALERDALIEPQLRALIYLRVALLNGCPF